MSQSRLEPDSPSREAPKILIVEDNFLAATHLSTMVEEMGLEVVGPVASVEDGVALAQTRDLDAAILDVSIREGDCLPIAEALRARGCPFLFATGYGSPEFARGRWEDVPILRKPINEEALARELSALLRKADRAED